VPEEKRPRNFRELLDKIRLSETVSADPDSQTTEEEEDLARQQKKAALEGLKQDIEERKKYAGRAFWLVVVWLLLIGVIIFFQGFKLYGFELSSGVLTTLIGSTTGSVVGIFLIVTRYLFPTAKSK
jgi:uncharacterized hydantoinase/oxoprolinase family protein